MADKNKDETKKVDASPAVDKVKPVVDKQDDKLIIVKVLETVSIPTSVIRKSGLNGFPKVLQFGAIVVSRPAENGELDTSDGVTLPHIVSEYMAKWLKDNMSYRNKVTSTGVTKTPCYKVYVR